MAKKNLLLQFVMGRNIILTGLTGQGVIAVNSANLWFPIGDGKLTVKLVHTEGKKSIASGELKDWSEVFVIGYRA